MYKVKSERGWKQALSRKYGGRPWGDLGADIMTFASKNYIKVKSIREFTPKEFPFVYVWDDEYMIINIIYPSDLK